MKKTVLTGFAIASLMILFLSCLNQKVTLKERWQNLAAQNREEQTRLWQEDLERYAKLLTRKHQDPYKEISEEDFLAEIQQFRENLPDMNNLERYGELLQITALLEDGHSQLVTGLTQRYFPFRVQSFTEGIYIVETDSSFTELLGARIMMIGSEPVEMILPRITPYLSAVNRVDLKNRQIHSLENAELLALAGVLKDGDQGVFTLKNSDGETQTLLIPSSPDFAEVDISLQDRIDGKDQKYFTETLENYSLRYLKEGGILHLQINRLQEREDYPVDQLLDDLISLEEEESPRFLVLDFRSCREGDNRLFRPVWKYLKEESGMNRRGRLFGAIGRDTYGSAMVNLMELEKDSHILFIGESTSEKPNHFGEEKSFLLPNTGIEVFYSTKFFQVRERETQTLDPQIPVKYTFEDYAQGIDPLLQMIREQSGEKP